ncbi:MAG: hypothetical protein NVS2B16_19000 [Chloroflexota bacterium]
MADFPNSRLVIVGGTKTVEPFDVGLGDSNVLVRPWSPAIELYYRAADIFVLPSLVEGMSNALLEAMACGLACVATRVGAAESMINHGRTGLLVGPNDPTELRAALERLVHGPAERLRIGAAAASTIADQYAIDRVVAAIVSRALSRPLR